MGDYFERVIDVEVSQEEAGPLAERVVDWLVGEGVVTRETDSSCVYSMYVDEGYVPGPRWERAVQDAGWEPGPLAVIVGRHAHVGGQGDVEPESAQCPRCGALRVFIDYPNTFEPDEELWAPFGAAVKAWEAAGAGDVDCPGCGESSAVTDWLGPDYYALGSLTFEFCGWPPLSDDFVAELGRVLGHRIAQHMGKVWPLRPSRPAPRQILPGSLFREDVTRPTGNVFPGCLLLRVSVVHQHPRGKS